MSLLELTQFRNVKIIGNYKFLYANDTKCSFLYDRYKVSVTGQSVKVDAIKKEMLYLSVEKLEEVHLQLVQGDGANDAME